MALLERPKGLVADNYVDGAWRPTGGESRTSLDPATGTVLGAYAPGSVELIDEAVASARAAFERTDWASAPRMRADVLLAFAANMARDHEALATLNAYENGKSFTQAKAEVGAAISETKYYAGLARAASGRMMEPEPGAYSMISREPVGVAAVIVPWNAPVTLLIRSLAAALAAGCTAVVKPAPQTPLINAAVLKHLFDVPHLPKGVVSSVNDGGVAVSERLVVHPDVDVISFTGSSAVGKRIMAAAAPSLKRVSLELGGKTPSIVFDDADLDLATVELTRASLVNSGQQCVAASRFLVQRGVLEALSEKLSARFRTLKVGPGYDTDNQVGALIDRANRDRLTGWLDRAAGEGEVVLRGTTLEDIYPGGAFLTPSLVLLENTASPIVQEELFGPIITLEPFDDADEALAKAHATAYGLAASVFTRDLERGMRMARRLRAGTVWLNVHGKLLAEAEMEGHRDSGVGRLHGADALGEFQHTKHIYVPFGH
ncbi:aldehyde dehydrogenase family protein [Devosia nitrariae]|uniref:Aldehyde dehydrogenase n=1 Tax=Devosia nitrariae TaxID=2071872 RepID=A0ABQ5W6A5_9HYPH|nr:aldehyde dehydrogenase family protein [Devosia nitrariae]GLQ55595.1 aldehyde dehydrogenase [Devosia nitrariae]